MAKRKYETAKSLKGHVPFRCGFHPTKRQAARGMKRCWKRVRMIPGIRNGEIKCPACGHYTLYIDTCRLKGRKVPNKDHPERCDCNGPKRRIGDKVVYENGVKRVFGPHRKGQYGCQHSPLYGHVEGPDEEYLAALEKSLGEPVEEPCPF